MGNLFTYCCTGRDDSVVCKECKIQMKTHVVCDFCKTMDEPYVFHAIDLTSDDTLYFL